MTAIGTYKFMFAQGRYPHEAMYGDLPIYGTRYGDTASGRMFQVLIAGIEGVPQWINVNREDVTLEEGQEWTTQ